jgi:hypothetical protein
MYRIQENEVVSLAGFAVVFRLCNLRGAALVGSGDPKVIMEFEPCDARRREPGTSLGIQVRSGDSDAALIPCLFSG